MIVQVNIEELRFAFEEVAIELDSSVPDESRGMHIARLGARLAIADAFRLLSKKLGEE